jgi:integrase
MWTDEDIALFLKYCTDNQRLRFYHSLAMETSGRPGELLQVKVEDINIETDTEGNSYVTLDIGRYGNKRESRIVGITEFSIQYYRQFLLPEHPDNTNKNAFVFLNREKGAEDRNVPLSQQSL